ncbi:beta-mannanase-like protein (plasmid) [Pseudarthrobacter chlorophenolicus A6]|uniref:Beta-mannanase-like protein n=1 Tax=Pseudarthrobacter chlorophenolicus (strain ATCC 700700 / DSM 12829 / CIP 107037 / JCM 12360 / KCTC 9906 / NCIMB 13794 / A6) TaxID=452863 RepID=B8HJ25_PSECP|nr:glycosyl hydrolase [Pseudarthrobacter chlorophenolicus]ACL42422.1 beta-mannanase-like protein [Pseudarthrobacter chlorophenolicus A6]SDQ17911.1 Glycosyl hydrolase family 26 [Pseudarthrobacter chlorophenolicus]
MNHTANRRTILGLGLAAAISGAGAAAAQATSAAMTLSPTTGPVGTTVSVTGTGFPGLTTGSLTLGSNKVALKTLKNGTFTASIVVPAGTAAIAPVTAQVGRTTLSTNFTVAAAETSASLPPVSSALLRFGLIPAAGIAGSAEIDATSKLVGEQPALLLGYRDFQQAAPIAELDAATTRGAIPMMTWEPWVAGAGAGAVQPAYTLAAIAAGNFDTYITQWGAGLASWGKPVMLRFAHEMNGDWYPWCETVNGNQPGDYIRAWQHVHDLVTAAGAFNVTWVWAPNGGGPGDMAAMYPGDGYVDVLGLDAYNWGTTQSWSSWQSPDALFGYWLDQLRVIAPGKQIIITETASTETGGSKADWNTSLVPYLNSQPDVTGFIWFNLNKETDWRIESSTASSNAFTAALAARR